MPASCSRCPANADSTFTAVLLLFKFNQCCFTFTESIRTIRDWEHRTATSTFSHTAPEFGFTPVLFLCFILRPHSARGGDLALGHRGCSLQWLYRVLEWLACRLRWLYRVLGDEPCTVRCMSHRNGAARSLHVQLGHKEATCRFSCLL